MRPATGVNNTASDHEFGSTALPAWILTYCSFRCCCRNPNQDCNCHWCHHYCLLRISQTIQHRTGDLSRHYMQQELLVFDISRATARRRSKRKASQYIVATRCFYGLQKPQMLAVKAGKKRRRQHSLPCYTDRPKHSGGGSLRVSGVPRL